MLFSDYGNVTASVTHQDYAKDILSREEVTSNIIHFNDIVALDVYEKIESNLTFGLYLAILVTDQCENYEFMSQTGCTDHCIFQECNFESSEISSDVLYCKSRCFPGPEVLIQRKVKFGMPYLPTTIEIVGLVAMSLLD